MLAVFFLAVKGMKEARCVYFVFLKTTIED